MKASLLALLATTAAASAQGNAPYLPVNPADTSPAGALDAIPQMVVAPRAVAPEVVPTLEDHRAALDDG